MGCHEVLFSIVKVLAISANTVLAAPAVVAAATLDSRWAYWICQLWVRLNLLVSGVDVHTRREGELDPSEPYVFMSNHQSHFDVLAVVAAIPEFQLRWVAKQELTRIPFFGWALAHADHIIIDRSDHAQAVASLRAAEEKMRRGCSVIIFPEGTRGGGDGVLLPFKKGGFVLALETGISIVPIAVRGSQSILPRGGWQIAEGDIDVIVGEPIPVDGLDRDTLMRRVRAQLEQQLCAPVVREGARAPRFAEAR